MADHYVCEARQSKLHVCVAAAVRASNCVEAMANFRGRLRLDDRCWAWPEKDISWAISPVGMPPEDAVGVVETMTPAECRAYRWPGDKDMPSFLVWMLPGQVSPKRAKVVHPSVAGETIDVYVARRPKKGKKRD